MAKIRGGEKSRWRNYGGEMGGGETKAKVCRSLAASSVKEKAVETVTDHLDNVNTSSHRAHVTVAVNGTPVRFRIDSGADVTAIGEDLWKKLGRCLAVYEVRCTAVNGQDLDICGTFSAKFSCADAFTENSVLGLRRSNVALLGRQVPYELKLLGLSPAVAIYARRQAEIDVFVSVFCSQKGLVCAPRRKFRYI